MAEGFRERLEMFRVEQMCHVEHLFHAKQTCHVEH
jgi:hypothetical protein